MTSKAEQIKIDSKNLRGTLAKSLENPVTGQLFEDDKNLIKFHGIYEQDDRDIRDRRAEKKLEPAYSFMIRLRIAGGKVSKEQWLGMHDLSEENASPVIKITTRQTIQFHGVIKSKLKPTVQWFDKYGLDSIAACGDVNRNVMSTVTVAKNKAYDEVYEITKELSDKLLPATKAYNEIWLDGEKLSGEKEEEPMYGETYLPRKFKIAVAIPPDNDVDVFAHDIGLIAIIENSQLAGFNVSIGGGMGSTHGNAETFPRLGDIIGFVAAEHAVALAKGVLTTQRDFGNREDRKQARLKYTIEKLGLEKFVSELKARIDFKIEAPRVHEFSTRNDYYGWHEDYAGKLHYLLFVENGRVLDDGDYKLKSALYKITKSGLADIRFTSNQNIILTNIATKNKAKVIDILASHNVGNDNSSNIRKSAMACVALNTCPLALAEAQRYMPDLITEIDKLSKKHKITESISMRMTGCPNGCARPFMAEVGFVGKSAGTYNFYLGGSATGERLNTLYKEDLKEPEILSELDGLFSKYSKEKSEGESFGDFTNNLIAN